MVVYMHVCVLLFLYFLVTRVIILLQNLPVEGPLRNSISTRCRAHKIQKSTRCRATKKLNIYPLWGSQNTKKLKILAALNEIIRFGVFNHLP